MSDFMRKIALLLVPISMIFLSAACASTPRQPEAQLTAPQSSMAAPEVYTGESAEISENRYTQIYEQTNPGVVALYVTLQDGSGGQGSGFMFDDAGHIMTNYHVIQDAAAIEVVLASGYRAAGTVIGTDLDSDLAVVTADFPAEEINPLRLGTSKDVSVGQTVLAIGNPYGLSGTLTVGIVSARGRLLDSMRVSTTGSNFTAADLIQTDAAINPGNSGGPLLNLDGEVIGVTRAIRTTGEEGVSTLANSGIGFAVPIDIVKRVAPYLIANGQYDYPYLGIVSKEALTLAEHEKLGIPVTVRGAYVIMAVKGGPAAKAGIIGGTDQADYTELPSGGDLITAVDDQPVRAFSDLLSYLVTYKSPGDTMQVTLLRDGMQMTVPVVLASRSN
jgi:2-alkenal reductase